MHWELGFVFSFPMLKHGMELDHERAKPFGVTLQRVCHLVTVRVSI